MRSLFHQKKGKFSLLNNRTNEWYATSLVQIHAVNHRRQHHNTTAHLKNTIASTLYSMAKEEMPKELESKTVAMQRIPVHFEGVDIHTYQTANQKQVSTKELIIVTVVDGQKERTIHLRFTTPQGGDYELVN